MPKPLIIFGLLNELDTSFKSTLKTDLGPLPPLFKAEEGFSLCMQNWAVMKTAEVSPLLQQNVSEALYSPYM